MKLTLDLVPATTWYDNLRSRLPKREWDRLRRATYAAAGHQCEVCGGKGRKHPVECHEIWDYDEEARVQRLAGFIALCPTCHEVKHFGRAMHVGRGHLALAHLMRVNQWTLEQAQGHVSSALREWGHRSRVTWTLDLSWLDRPAADKPEPQ